MTTDDPDRAPESDAVEHAEPEAAEPQRRQPATAKWWFSGAIRLIGGVAIAGMQWSVISTGDEVAFNWVFVAIGVAVAAWGVVVLVQDRPRS